MFRDGIELATGQVETYGRRVLFAVAHSDAADRSIGR